MAIFLKSCLVSAGWQDTQFAGVEHETQVMLESLSVLPVIAVIGGDERPSASALASAAERALSLVRCRGGRLRCCERRRDVSVVDTAGATNARKSY